MIHLIVPLSKYLFLVLILFYVQASFWYMASARRRQKALASWQVFLILCFQALAYLVIFEETGDFLMLLFYLAQLVFFLLYQTVFRALYPDCSRLLLNHLCILMTIGLVIQTRLNASKAWTQFVILCVVGGATLVVPVVIKYWSRIYKIRWVFGLFGIVALGITFVTAQTEYGAKLSVTIGNLSVQLTELVKLSFIFFVAASFQKSTDRRQIFLTTVIAALHVLVLVGCNDLGAALIFFLSYVFMLFVATRNGFLFFGGLAAGAGASVVAYELFDHVKVRVSTWLNPWKDITNTGWQIAQSLFAIGAGGWFGVGLYQGTPTSIPVVLKDFVFAAICEEFGGLFALCLLLIYISCLVQFLWTATSMTETFHKIVCFGLACVMGIQILLNIGGVTKFLPMTGVTLPLVSYGGSSALCTFLIFTLFQGFILMRHKEEREEAAQAAAAEAQRRRILEEERAAGRAGKEEQPRTDQGSRRHSTRPREERNADKAGDEEEERPGSRDEKSEKASRRRGK